MPQVFASRVSDRRRITRILFKYSRLEIEHVRIFRQPDSGDQPPRQNRNPPKPLFKGCDRRRHRNRTAGADTSGAYSQSVGARKDARQSGYIKKTQIDGNTRV